MTSADNSTEGQVHKGALAWMTRNTVAANLLMLILIAAGFLGATQTKQEVFPDFSQDLVTVSMVYPGAGPAEVEQGLLLAVEERVRGLDGVKRVKSTAREGSGDVQIEGLLGADMDQLLADVKSEVDRITTFPADAERAQVSLRQPRREVISLILYGNHELRSLHTMAERARRGMLAAGGVTQVDISGVPPLEISVEIPRRSLERYGLSLEGVARELSEASLELPGGGIESSRGEVLLRVADRRIRGDQLEDIVLRGGRAGGELRLGDVATIIDGYANTKQRSVFNGKPALRVIAYRVGDETPTEVATAVKDYAQKLRAELPANVEIAVWDDNSERLRDRINLLLRNATMGLLLVIAILTLFLDLRLAFWVALGIPISFLGAFLLLGPTSFSINMITLFAFIVTLGMVVDDAIVVGERTFSFMSEGHAATDAAILAAKEMIVPITFAILTTIVAFSPLFFVPGNMGKIMGLIPAVVIAVLVVSLLESFLILPAHLGHRRRGSRLPREGLQMRKVKPALLGQALEKFVQHIYRPILQLSIRYWAVSISLALVTVLLCWSVVSSGLIPFNFFPHLEGDIVKVNVRLPYGAPVERTEQIREQLERELWAELDARGVRSKVRGVLTNIGQLTGRRGNATEVGSHLASISVALVPSDEREFSTTEFTAAWRARIPELPGVRALTFSSATGPGAGAPVSVQLIHEDTEALAAASKQLEARLRDYPTLTNIDNEYAGGKEQLNFHLRDDARALGLSAREIARQLRSAFYGAEALREQRGRNELRIFVRLPQTERNSEYYLDSLQIRSPSGGYVPIDRLVDHERSRAATSIHRESGQRYVTVSAELAKGVESPKDTLDDLQSQVFPELRQNFPGLDIALTGAQREQSDTFASLQSGGVLALLVIYALLAIPFRSYLQPLIIMLVIPFGFVGAVAGHWMLGYGLSIMSIFGMVALAGVVVNDSLVLIDAANRLRREEKLPIAEAITQAGVSRFRPILLTSLTTYFGLAPMLAETSVQAKFLIPMAVSLGYGILYATVVVLLVVPAIYVVFESVAEFLGFGPN